MPKVGLSFDLGFVEIAAETRWFTRAWLDALIVLFLNTAGYTGEIFFMVRFVRCRSVMSRPPPPMA